GPQIGRFGEGELGRRDADYKIILIVQPDVLADDGWIGAEAAVPQRIAQNNFALAPFLILPGTEAPSDRRRHADHVKEIVADEVLDHTVRFVARADDIGEAVVPGRQVG